MPFTFCHPAAVLLFNYLPKKWISLTGLIAGSIIPDFEYFIRMQKLSLYSHSFAGLLLFNLPAGVLLTFIYHGIVHQTLIEYLPGRLRCRATRYAGFDWNEQFKSKWLVILISILIGAITHLLWDGFTLEAVTFINHRLPAEKGIFYYSFWTINSLIGAAIIAYAFSQLPKDKLQTPRKSVAVFWITAVCISVLIFIFRTFSSELLSIRDYIVSSVTASILGLILTALIFKYKHKFFLLTDK
jgi:hypothetical protein